MQLTPKIKRLNPYLKEFLLGKDPFPVLKEVNDTLRGRGLVYWVSAGTLLGLYRDGGFIDYDTDIDFEVLGNGKDFPEIGEPIKVSEDRDGNVYQRAYLCGPNIIVDVFFYRENGSKIYSYNFNKRLEYPKDFLKLTEIEFRGEKFPCPDPETYLTYMYGDWKKKENKKAVWT